MQTRENRENETQSRSIFQQVPERAAQSVCENGCGDFYLELVSGTEWRFVPPMSPELTRR